MKKLAEETIESYEKALKEVPILSNQSKSYKEKKQVTYKPAGQTKMSKTEWAYYERKQPE